MSRYWSELLQDDRTWKQLCQRHHFATGSQRTLHDPRTRLTASSAGGQSSGLGRIARGGPSEQTTKLSATQASTFRQHFKDAYLTEANWLRGGRVLAYHKSQDGGVVTCLAMDRQYAVIGMASGTIHIFDTATGSYRRSLRGHANGVWTMVIVSAMAKTSNADADASAQSRQNDHCNVVPSFGNRRPLLVTGGCDRLVHVWDLNTGAAVHTLHGHSATVRCVKVLAGQPIAVSGSRDSTLRVWNIEQGTLLSTLRGHTDSVRCIEVNANLVVSGSYDKTCRVGIYFA